MIFLFEGDAFNGGMVAAILRYESEVRIMIWQQGNAVVYEFENEAEAETKCREAIALWKEAAK
jgi:hypothetical protein